jgi:hypothetical protein
LSAKLNDSETKSHRFSIEYKPLTFRNLNSSISSEKNTYVSYVSDRNVKVEFNLDQNSHY